MDKNELNKKIADILGRWPGKFSILDYPVDLDLQIKYFETSAKVKTNNIDKEQVLNDSEKLFDSEIMDEEKKEILIKLAAIDNPDAYRQIEKFLERAEGYLYDWGRLALQESKLLLESIYLNEPRLFISTGLGGKDNLLRYFVVFFTKDFTDIEDYQKDIIKKELNFALSSKNYITEEIIFDRNVVMATVLVAFNEDVIKLMTDIIAECNLYGNFLYKSCLITNVKKLDINEIDHLIRKKIKDDQTYKL